MTESSNIIKPKLQPQEKRDQRKREKQAALIEASLRSGKYALFLQEVPKIKTSHCRAWDCMPRRSTGNPIIRSYYRFALKRISARSIEYYHITCLERLLPDLPNFVGYGYLKMDGWIAAPPDSHISIKSSSEAIKDWFHHKGWSFGIDCYECFNKDHDEWTQDTSFIWIEHILSHEERVDTDCCHCKSLPGASEPQRSHYFPKEPSAVSLSELLASVSGQPHIDK
ncbi:hypothetical protein BDV27DRAFT_151195 [Aspergillus caelatus]|uniref:Uncharacterized protein n=1 Tax=Aspergillus caelatus TaxID=61420 RepID=A0A5N6ZKW3_9EURO|nr:uncharacterized protein BDV27DRAFT_151195 [Aspergillus caelatus]KAE8357596.1 hypothetical protein BDV27DRAFT_151195 [Aspergillus caelatus]